MVQRVFAALAVAAALVILGGVITFVVLHGKSGAMTPLAADGSMTMDSAGPVAEMFHGDTLRRDESFAQLLARLGVDGTKIAAARSALESTDFDFRHMHPGDSVTLVYEDSVPASLSYHLDMATRYEVVFAGDAARAGLVTAPVETVEAVLSGVVEGSLWKTMTEAGASPQLVECFTEALRNALDLRHEVNEGDTFALLVQKRYVGGAFYRFGDIVALRYRAADKTTEAFLFRESDGRSFYCDASGRSLDRLLEYPPVLGGRRTSDFGPRFHPIRRRRIRHNGLDYAAPYRTPVRSVSTGAVAMRGWQGGYGRSVMVAHEDGTAARYSHLSQYGPGIGRGARVSKGQVVGFVGSTGLSTGFHLDFEVRQDGKAVDPLAVLPSGHRHVPEDQMPGFRQMVSELRDRMERAGPSRRSPESDTGGD
jgi:murein DD-endopeptidase MepM/ murein hydrolase activator NlpD